MEKLRVHFPPSGEVIADNVAYADFLKRFTGESVEWVYGNVIRVSPVSKDHNALSKFLIIFFDAYLGQTGGGTVLHNPMLMKPSAELPARAPDIQIVLPANEAIIEKNQVAGAADLVVEIVSPESQRRDRVEKFIEYEKAGVREYWIIDPNRLEALFYILEDGAYQLWQSDTNIYRSTVLPQLIIDIDLFWQTPLPRFSGIGAIVDAMLKDGEES